MKGLGNFPAKFVVTASSIAVLFFIPSVAEAHCDTLSGPVVMTARAALEMGDVTPVLKWVKKEHEGEIRAAFRKTLAVRSQGPDAKELADRYFFETVVRVHREGEGAPYTGLKPAGTDIGPAVAGADKALESGSVDGLAKLLVDEVAAGVRERFEHALAKKKHADESIQAGRDFVEAYVEFTHYAERLHLDATGAAAHHSAAEGPRAEGQHIH